MLLPVQPRRRHRIDQRRVRAYLKRLPDFDDIEAEKKALDYAQQSGNLDDPQSRFLEADNSRAWSISISDSREASLTEDIVQLSAIIRQGGVIRCD
jgi:hypothetical protein